MRSVLAVAAMMGAGALTAQTPRTQPVEGARDLFFAGAAPKDELPKIQKPAARPATPPAKRNPATNANTAPAGSAANLGLRYALLLVKGKVAEPVDPGRNFAKGDCVAINLESNRSGYLYVLAKESGGNWTPLFPTPELADQDNRIDPGMVVRTPKESCFEIEDPPGSETVFVVLSRAPRDIYELADSIKLPPSKVNQVVAQMSEAGTRDLPFKEVVKPAAPPAPVKKAAVQAQIAREPQHAVYVVKPAGDTLVTQIEIKHR